MSSHTAQDKLQTLKDVNMSEGMYGAATASRRIIAATLKTYGCAQSIKSCGTDLWECYS